MNSKKWWTLFISAILIVPVYKAVQACSDGPDPYDSYPSFFINSAVPDTRPYTPFFYTPYLKYYDEWYDYKEEETLPDANIQEWRTYTANAVPEADLDSFIYKFSYGDLSNFYNLVEKGIEPAPYSRSDFNGNAFTKWLAGKHDLEALGYLMYAKQCEAYAATGDHWGVPDRDSVHMIRLVKNGLQLQKAAKQDFFKWRYTYQGMRMAFYNGDYKQTLELYNTLIGTKTDGGAMYARCLGLKAGALFRTGRNTEAAYYYSRVFDLSDEGKRTAFISYTWAADSNNAPILKRCKTPHEQAVVQVMNGLRQYEEALPNMMAAYTADPQVQGLEVLMTREIQKAEERYQQPKLIAARNLTAGQWWYSRYDMDNQYGDADEKKKTLAAQAQYGSYLERLNAFAARVSADGKVKHKGFWQLSQSYIALMQDKPGEAKKYLDATPAAPLSTRERDLREIVNTLWIVKNAGHLTPKTESDLLPSLKWLDAQAGKSSAFDKVYRDLMGTVIASAYLHDGDTIKAIFTLARVRRSEGGKFEVDEDFQDLSGVLLEHISPAGLQAAQGFAAGSGKSDYDKWLRSGGSYSASALKELEGTKYLREHQFEKAVAPLKDVEAADLDKRRMPDPFIFHIQEVHEASGEDSAHMNTKLAFAKRMARLESDIAKNEHSADALFEYAMGLYNMTYYGKASSAFTYYRSSVDDYSYYESPDRKRLPDYLRDFYDAHTAEQYFVKAAAAATNGDQKAKCLWMAARCWQKRAPEATKEAHYGFEPDSFYYHYALGNPYFRQLRDASPAFEEQARSSCGYLRDYLSKRK